jgi:hypothetical protein
MSTTTGKRAARPKATARADQLRPLNIPQHVTVELDDEGLPVGIASCYRPTALQPYRPNNEEEQSETTDRGQAKRAVESIIETWHVDDEWWRDPIARRYVEVILEGGKHMILYEDLTANRWFMQMP